MIPCNKNHVTKERLIKLLLLEETEDNEYPFRCIPTISLVLAKIKADRIMDEIKKEVKVKTADNTEYAEPARGDKAEAIRRKYCLENDQVYDCETLFGNDDIIYSKINGQDKDIRKSQEQYLCFSASELGSIMHKGILYFIKRIKN